MPTNCYKARMTAQPQFKKELAALPQPFMSALFTVSSHSPYDFPAEHKLSFNSKANKYVNSVAYTDQCLGEFMKRAKEEDWYENTLFVLVADHSHNSPREWRLAQKEAELYFQGAFKQYMDL